MIPLIFELYDLYVRSIFVFASYLLCCIMLVLGESLCWMLDSAILIKFSFVFIIVEYRVVLPLFYIDVASWNSWSMLLPSMFIYLNSISPLNFFIGVPILLRLLDRRFTPLIYDDSLLLTNDSPPEIYNTPPWAFIIASPAKLGIQWFFFSLIYLKK